MTTSVDIYLTDARDIRDISARDLSSPGHDPIVSLRLDDVRLFLRDPAVDAIEEALTEARAILAASGETTHPACEVDHRQGDVA